MLKRPDVDPAEGIGVGFTDRDGGVTPAEGTLSFGATDGGPDRLAENVRRIREDAGFRRLVTLHQVHSARVHLVDDAFLAGQDRGEQPDGDALIAGPGMPGVALAVRAADCVPVILADPHRRVIGAAHAGRAGVLSDVVGATVAAMHDLGARDLVAWVGPHIHGECYEVPAGMAEAAAALVPATRATTRWGTPAIDLTAGVRSRLDELGIPVAYVGACTLTDSTLHSHRRDGAAAGRQLGLVWSA
ncbi:polyphenol oxidase family protein [Raineyella antarctica]|uniref:polyphenol oxidase family protein n=1 Tax=Raineyella antarctica TaxID=1577474 RepID=UPI0015880836|nr:polyphenol oxidase family protein [Raineyella antarctica]